MVVIKTPYAAACLGRHTEISQSGKLRKHPKAELTGGRGLTTVGMFIFLYKGQNFLSRLYD